MAELVAAGVLALVHLVAGHLAPRNRNARELLLSGAGGVSLAFAVVFLLPELATSQRIVQRETGGVLGREAYLLALLGILCFYGLETILAQRAPRRDRRASHERSLFWAHISAFALYNALIGYLIAHEGELGTGNLLLFTIAVALHFTANDNAMREHHRHAYDRVGRWVLVPAPLAGLLIGMVLPLPEHWLSVVLAFLVGGIVLNVLKEELPEERSGRFMPFLVGAVAYSLLVLLV